MGKEPGRYYRKGITIVKLLEMFPDDATAEAWFAERRWKGEPVCPHCGSFNTQSGASHRTMLTAAETAASGSA